MREGSGLLCCALRAPGSNVFLTQVGFLKARRVILKSDCDDYEHFGQFSGSAPGTAMTGTQHGPIVLGSSCLGDKSPCPSLTGLFL